MVFSGDKNTAPVESVNETVTETQPSQELAAQKAELERQKQELEQQKAEQDTLAQQQAEAQRQKDQQAQQEAEQQQVEAERQLQDQSNQDALAQQKADLAQQKAELERQKAEQVLARQKAEKAKREEAEKAKREEAEKAKRKETAKQQIGSNQVESQITTALINADKALRMKNYGTAKRLAREILVISPNNAQALRIVRQAEDGESKAFQEMIIE